MIIIIKHIVYVQQKMTKSTKEKMTRVVSIITLSIRRWHLKKNVVVKIRDNLIDLF